MKRIQRIPMQVPMELEKRVLLIIKIFNKNIPGSVVTTTKISPGKEEAIHHFKRNFKVVEKRKKYYFRVKWLSFPFTTKDIGPMPRDVVEKLISPMLEQRNQTRKKVILKRFLGRILKDSNEEFSIAYLALEETFKEKVKAIKEMTFDKAAGLRDKEKELREKMFFITKGLISNESKFKWVKEDDIWDILELFFPSLPTKKHLE